MEEVGPETCEKKQIWQYVRANHPGSANQEAGADHLAQTFGKRYDIVGSSRSGSNL